LIEIKNNAEKANKVLEEKEKELVKIRSELDRIKVAGSNKINDLQTKIQELKKEKNYL
jgi:capsule polysaccharide export protein KpsE/RkpR